MKLITCKNGHRYDPELTPECPECVLMDCGGLDFDLDDLDYSADPPLREDEKRSPEYTEPDMRTCEKGHLYDAGLTKECPFCAMGEFDLDPEPVIREPAQKLASSERWVTCKNGHRYDPGLTQECPECAMFSNIDFVDLLDLEPINLNGPVDDSGSSLEEYWIAEPLPGAFMRNQSPKHMVTGWLVCIQGPEYGKSYPLYEENNYIGQSPENEISIPGDATIANKGHCVITYDDIDREFYVGLCQGTEIIRLNDRPVLMTQELKSCDRLKIGMGTYRFVPLCGEDFDWKDYPPTP